MLEQWYCLVLLGKVKLTCSLCRKILQGLESKVPYILTFGNGGQWLDSCSNLLISSCKNRFPKWAGSWLGVRSGLGSVIKRKHLNSYWDSNIGVQSVAYTDSDLSRLIKYFKSVRIPAEKYNLDMYWM